MAKAAQKAALYFIEAEGIDFVKIGQSRNPRQRLRQLNTGSPYKLRLRQVLDGDGYLEPHIKRLLQERVSMNGEWFLATQLDIPALITEARSIAEQPYVAQQSSALGTAHPSSSLGHEIRWAREKRGMKQKDLVAATGLTQKYISEIESNKVDPRFSIVQRIATALDTTLTQLGGRPINACDAHVAMLAWLRAINTDK